MRTLDHAMVIDRQTFHAPTGLGKSRRITPEGFLLCEGVAIGRTGEQVYGAGEIKGVPSKNGYIIVERTEDEVFNPIAMESYAGKCITVEHPAEFVGPHNFRKVATGDIHNVRRGTGDEANLLLADLLIKDSLAIAYANSSFPEVSCGYNCDYEIIAPGRARQKNIRGNHLALVKRGRAGARCSIKDHRSTETFSMTKKLSIGAKISKLLTAFQSNDAEAVESAAQELTTHDHEEVPLAPGSTMDAAAIAKIVNDTMDKREAAKAKEASDAAALQAKATADAAAAAEAIKPKFSQEQLATIVSRAEILAPGIALPTKDADLGVEVPALMRKALATAHATQDGKLHVETFLMGGDLKALTNDSLLGIFTGAAELKRAANKQSNFKLFATPGGKTQDGKPLDVAAEMDSFWAAANGKV